jgi:hypothetical protein
MAFDVDATVARLQDEHPEWNVVDAVEAPGGGFWALGADGGVFAMGGAPFLGSAAGQEYFGGRTATSIEQDPRGGYSLFSQNNERYWVSEGYPTTTVAPPTDLGPQAGATPPAVNPVDQSGKATFTATMIDLGFTPAAAESLANQLWNPSKIKSADELMLDLRKTPEYTSRFAGIIALRERAAKGEYIPYIPTESEYVNLEGGMRQEAIKAGLPPGFYDEPSDFAALIGGGVSVAEYSSRLGRATQAALGTDPTLRDELSRTFGTSLGDLTAFFLDPAKGQKVIETKYAQAEIGTAARRSGFGMLTKAEKATLQGRGLTPERAGAGMAEVAMASPLEQELAGETRTGSKLTRAQQLGLATGEGADVAAFERRRKSRQAAFEGGGGAAGGGQGPTGLGSAR